MKIKLCTEDLRMTVLKQIVENASLCMKIEREMNLINRMFPFTPTNFRLSRLQDRGNKLEKFQTALSKNKDEFVMIDYSDVDFIYHGLN